MNIIELKKKLNPELVKYIENEILPRYEKLPGHTTAHIDQVISRSLEFAEKINLGEIEVGAHEFEILPTSVRNGEKINLDMCYVVAAFHDLGRSVDDKRHHLISAGFLLTDAKLPEFFDRDQLRVMADAVMDHRASNELDPLTIYGKIVSTADRNTDATAMVKRAYESRRGRYPDWSDEEVIEQSRLHLREKYGGADGYAAKKFFFPDPDFTKFLQDIEEITADAERYSKFAREAVRLDGSRHIDKNT